MSEPTVENRQWTSEQRRTQLLAAARTVFARKGFIDITIDEIAAKAGVDRKIIHEHYGGKEGLYAVLIDQSVNTLLGMLREAMKDPYAGSHNLVEGAVRALLDFIENCPDCFHILMRDFSELGGFGAASILGDATSHVESLFVPAFQGKAVEPKAIPLWSQALTGMVAITGQWWMAHPEYDKEEVARYLIELIWAGIAPIDLPPREETAN